LVSDAPLRERLTVTPERFRVAAWAALLLLALIVFTGAAVRLTDSGLGCLDWPRCSSNHLTPPDQLHALIEFGNRAASGIVGVVTVVVMAMAFLRRPLRRDLVALSTLLPLGVVAQAVLGGYTVKEKLAPGFVMAHFGLSMIILIAAVALVWRTDHPAGSRPRVASRMLVWTVRLTVLLGALTVFAGTVSTAAGPHSGAHIGQIVRRLRFRGAGTLEWAVHQHATVAALFGLAAIAAWLLKRRELGTLEPTEPLTVLAVLIAGQGLLGSVQYELKLPAEMVWLHASLATVTWVVALWAWADTGRSRRAGEGTGGPERVSVGEPLADAPERSIEAAPL
jgi:cytochrome c oxidase assembly protein subunit 15